MSTIANDGLTWSGTGRVPSGRQRVNGLCAHLFCCGI